MRPRVLTAAGAILLMAGAALAQYGGPRGPFHQYPNIPYDGRFTFVRLKYTHGPGGNWYGGWPAWGHGYPLSEQNLMRIMQEVSDIGPHVDDINAITLDDPELFRYPLAYIIEVDWWAMSDREAEALRVYLQKGGFVIVDDFKPRRGRFGGRFGGGLGGDLGGGYGMGWEVFEQAMTRVLPQGKFVELDASHPIFHTFFEVDRLDIIPQAYIAGRPVFYGLFEDNDPNKRLQMIVNYNTDVSQFWEWSGTGLRPIDDTNEAYKLGVNYIIYGLTH
ncbi:MAG TPA: DUF4159 domain-containing protein [Vicinamibacterales bacterium]|nr:DUF4159 domain-containing protein [Vicinamibacterales bacterium]